MPIAINITPDQPGLDQSVRIEVSGLVPGERVMLIAQTRDADQSLWRSRAEFLVPADGRLDLTRDAPFSGDYHGVDGEGLLWSQQQVEVGPSKALGAEAVAPSTTEIDVRGDAGSRARVSLTRHFVATGVTRRDVVEDGIVGSLYTPAGPGPFPAVVYLNGSGGGINEARAALLASHGYAALALGYFGAPGLPTHISGTPLEYFERALRWLHANVRPAHGFVAVSGQSRGGELSLLLAATFPELTGAVVAYVPSSVIHGVLAAGRPGESRYAPAWMHHGQPLTSVWQDNEQHEAWTQVDRSAEPRRQVQPFLDAHAVAPMREQARIPVERIRGPVLLISGGDDGYWPSTEYSAEIVRTLKAHSHAYPVEHLDYPGAGHSIQAPHVPATVIARAHAVSGVVLTAGGQPAANAHANAHSWARSLEFLHAAVKARGDADQACAAGR